MSTHFQLSNDTKTTNTTQQLVAFLMTCMLTSNMVDHGFEPRSGQIKDNNIGICRFSAKYLA
jgi:hypothetical protein